MTGFRRAAAIARRWLAAAILATSDRLARIARRLDPATTVRPPVGTVQPIVQAGFSSFLTLLFRRLLIWVVAAGVAFYVPLRDAGLLTSMADLQDWQQRIVADGRLSDMFLATLAMAVLSASDLIDNVIAAREGESDAISAGSGWLLIVAYFMFLLYGAPLYTAASPPHQLALAWSVLWLVLALSLAGEIVITLATVHRRP